MVTVLLLVIAGGVSGGLILPVHTAGIQPLSDVASVTTSWNQNVACVPVTVTFSDILGSAYPSQSLSGSPWQTNSTGGGIPDKRSLSPSCTLTNTRGQLVSTFVQLDNVSFSNYFYETRDCSTSFNPVNNGGGPYPNGQTLCDSTGDVMEAGTTNSAYIHVEIDQDWMAQGYCGPSSAQCNNDTIASGQSCTVGSPCSIGAILDLQGFVFWDSEGQWELHPMTGWRTSQPTASQLTTGFSATPSGPTVGQAVTFTGTAQGGTTPYSFSWGFGDGANGTGAIAFHTYNAKGAYSVSLTVADSEGKMGTARQVITIGVTGSNPAPAPSYLWLMIAGGGLGLNAALVSLNLRARAQLRRVREGLAK